MVVERLCANFRMEYKNGMKMNDVLYTYLCLKTRKKFFLSICYCVHLSAGLVRRCPCILYFMKMKNE